MRENQEDSYEHLFNILKKEQEKIKSVCSENGYTSIAIARLDALQVIMDYSIMNAEHENGEEDESKKSEASTTYRRGCYI